MKRTSPLAAILLSLAACGPAPDDPTPDGGAAAPVLEVTRTVDLGEGCLNAGALAVAGDTAYVACGGDFTGNGALATVDLGTYAVSVHAVGGAPGSIAVTPDRVYLGDMLDGRVFEAGADGTVLHGADDPVVLCPSDAANGIFQFVPDVEVLGEDAVASCFASDEVVRFAVADGASGQGGIANAEVRARVGVGDGPGALSPWGADDVVVLDGLAGTASLAHLGPSPSAEVDRWTTGEAPNDVLVVGDRAWIANSTSNTVQVVDLAADATVQEVNTGDATSPWSLARLGDDLAAVPLNLSQEVAVVDLAAGAVLGRTAMPTGEALAPLPGRTPIPRPQGIAVTSDGRVLVSLTNLGEDYQPAGHGVLVVLEEATP